VLCIWDVITFSVSCYDYRCCSQNSQALTVYLFGGEWNLQIWT
jgi:hypothetical protein